VGYPRCLVGAYCWHMTTPKGRIDLLAELARDPENGFVQLSGGWYWVRTYPEVSTKPLVRIAIEMLDTWGIVDPEAAKAVLSWWSRYDELTPEDLAQLIDHYTSPSLMRGQIKHDGTENRD
jgi:hypothetical protein